MAKENIAFLVNLRKNTAVGSDREGRYYPEAESKEALTTKGFAKHVSEHGGLVTYEFMQLVLAAIVKCLKEMMSQGQPVKLNFVFIPENAQGEEITSKKFKEQCSLQFAYLVETIKKTINGKEKSYTLRTPLSAYGIVDAEADAEGGSDSQGGSSQTGGDNTQSGGSTDTGGNQGGGSTIPGEGD